jgi:hypothetical protein
MATWMNRWLFVNGVKFKPKTHESRTRRYAWLLDRDVEVRANTSTGFWYTVNVQPHPASCGGSVLNVNAAAGVLVKLRPDVFCRICRCCNCSDNLAKRSWIAVGCYLDSINSPIDNETCQPSATDYFSSPAAINQRASRKLTNPGCWKAARLPWLRLKPPDPPLNRVRPVLFWEQ